MKSKGLSALAFVLVTVVAASCSQSQPVNSAQVMAWLASGIHSARLIRIVREHGVAAIPGKEQIRQLESAGADPELILALTGALTSAPDQREAV